MFKTFTGALELKADGDEPGAFKATFSTLNVPDRDQDVTLPGAFTDGQPVRIASWGHKWSDLPVGLGTIHADQDRAWVAGRFFTDTTPGLDTYKTVKALGALQEWSYGFEILEATFGQHDGQDVRFLKRLNVFEVSPVLIGAGIGTQTDSIKASDRRAEPGLIGDQADRLVADLTTLAEATRSLLAGLPNGAADLSETKRRKLAHLVETFSTLAAVRADLEQVLAIPAKSTAVTVEPAALVAEWLRVQAHLSGILEVAP